MSVGLLAHFRRRRLVETQTQTKRARKRASEQADSMIRYKTIPSSSSSCSRFPLFVSVFRLLYLLHFFADDDGIGFAKLLGAQRVIIEGALMLVRVAVKAAEKTAAATVESCESDFLAAFVASVLLGFLAVFVSLFGGSLGDGAAVLCATRCFRTAAARSGGGGDDRNCRRSRLQCGRKADAGRLRRSGGR